MLIAATFTIDDERLRTMTSRLENILLDKLEPATQKGLEKARNYTKRRLTGEVLRVQTGRLRNSIAIDVDRKPDRIIGRIGTNVIYGRFWELGGTIPAHTIFPRFAQALHFFVGGQEVFVKHAHIPARTEQARPFLQPSLEEAIPQFQGYWKRATNIAIREAMQ